MINKKIIFILCFIICLISIASASASEFNDTDELVFTESADSIMQSSDVDISNQINDDLIRNQTEINNEVFIEDTVEINNTNNVIHENYSNRCTKGYTKINEVLGATSEDIYYKIVMPSVTTNYGNTVTIGVTLKSYENVLLQPLSYSYDFHLEIYDENGKLIVTSNKFSGSSRGDTNLEYCVDSTKIDSEYYHIFALRKYVVKFVSLNQVRATTDLIITHKSNYKVELNLSSTTIKKGENTEITMTVTQYDDIIYKYNFYLKVYDSKNNLIINKRYFNTNCNPKDILYYTIKANDLSAGTYTVNICIEDKTYSSKKLTILDTTTNTGPGYSVNIDDHYFTFGTTNTVRLNVFQDNENPSNNYGFYINIYDTQNKRLIRQYCSGSNWGTVSVKLNTSNLKVDNYTIKIISSGGTNLDTANLIVENSADYNYLMVVSDTTINYGSNGNITMNIYPAYKGYYYYDFYLKVYDSNNNEIISKRYSNSSNSNCVENYSFNPMSLKSGNYAIRLINYNKSSPNCYSKLIVKPKPSSGYSAWILSDVAIKKGENGKITMCISRIEPNSKFSYDFYLKVYDPKGRLKINQRFKNEGTYLCNEYANIGSTFTSGVYTVNLVDTEGNFVMDSAKLIVGSLSNLDYSVTVQNTSMELNAKNYIDIYISKTSDGSYTYDFYLKIFDSNGNELICERFNEFDLNVWYLGYKETYKLDKNIFTPGNYTIKIINNGDNCLMSIANLNIESIPHNYYSASVNDINAYYDSNVTIPIKIDPPNHSCTYDYDFYLKVYDSNNVEKISKRFSNWHLEDFEYYTIDNKILSAGEYTIKIINYQDNYVMDTASLVLYKHTANIIANDVTTNYNNNDYLVVTILDQYGQAIVGGKIFVNLDGVKSLTTDANGQVKVSTRGLNPNIYTVAITYDGNDSYDKSTTLTKIVVNKLKVSLSSPDVNVVYNINGNLVATLKDNAGNVLDGVDMLIDMGSGVKTLTTDSNGQIKVSTKGLVPKLYSVKITFNGNSIFEKITKSVKINVKKATPKINAKAMTFKKSVKTKKYSITLKNNLNKVMKNTKVTIKVNGKTYYAKTNSKGTATFKITKLTKKGTFKATVTYAGNSYYNKVTKKINIKCK